MASWKKVIVSGSQAELAAVTASGFVGGTFSGSSFTGNGSGLTGVTATAIFPTNAVTDITATDRIFISTSAGNSFISYSALLTDIAGTNLTAGTDDISLATTITGLTSVTSTGFTGSLLGTASWATNALTASFLPAGTYQITAATASTVSTTATSNAATYYIPFVANATSTTSETIRVDADITYNPSTNDLTIGGDLTVNGNDIKGSGGTVLTFSGTNVSTAANLTVTGDLTVSGTTTTVNTNNLLVEDQFIMIASGSTTATDAGIMVDRGAYASASIVFGFDAATERFGFQNGLSDTDNAISITNTTASAFVGLVLTEGAHSGTKPTNGEFVKFGTMYIATNEDIWIYS